MGNKHWTNTWTEIEDLGKGKFAAEIHVGHRVFKDKADGQYKKHKLTDERPTKDYVLVQSAKCCVEIYPYYAKYFDVNHEEVRLYEERWVVQRLFKEPDKWRDVDAYNPVISVEEYSEPAGDVVKVTIAYNTDYGKLVVEYFQRDGNALKHNISFKNTSGSTETFRVLQRWSGIVGSKCNDKNTSIAEDVPYLAFHNSDKPKKKFNIAENLYSMIFNEDGSEKTEQCLQRPISIGTHAQGMKADFIYGNWVLAQDENLEIDPDTVTLDNPTEDGYIQGLNLVRNGFTANYILIGKWTTPSFLPDTKILLVDNTYKFIENIKKGEWIRSFDPYENKSHISKILDHISHRASEYLIINGLLKITPSHQVWSNGAFERADKLKVGDKLLNSLNREVYITTIEKIEVDVIVHDLIISYPNTFYAEGLLVHNPPTVDRGFVEWDISSIPDEVTITDTIFKYHGKTHQGDCHIHEMLGARPSTSTNSDVYDEIGEGTIYADPAGFPVEGTNKQVDLGASADSDLQNQLSVDWFAIGIQNDDEGSSLLSTIYAEEWASTPDPTLYVEYEEAVGNALFFGSNF